MPSSLPPYALDLTVFRFPALAALAGRAPLGGAREAALAALLVARLVAQAAAVHDVDAAAERGALARQWLAGLSLPQGSRVPLNRMVDAATRGAQPAALRAALDATLAALSPLLDPSARTELQQLAQNLGT